MMMKLVSVLPILCALAQAQDLEHPALTDNLDYLMAGNEKNLHPTNSSITAWDEGYIPEDCKSIAEGQDLDPSDFEMYDVFYSDCSDPWILCRHKDSLIDVKTTVETFSKVPVRSRSWVRHVLTIPGVDWAFNSNGNIALSGETSSNIDVILHETGHSLDLLGAFGDEDLSSSDAWLDAYAQDTHVPDEYARTNQVENVAQNVVVSIYDTVNPGGFPGIQPDYKNIYTQYSTVEDVAGDTIVPGGVCDRHLENSETVPLPTSSKSTVRSSRFRLRRFPSGRPDTSLKGLYKNIVKDFTPFDTKENCKLTFA